MKTSLPRVVESLIGCHHQQLSRVFTIRRRTYRVCLQCGREIEYSWALMHSLRPNGSDDVHAPLNSSSPADVSTI